MENLNETQLEIFKKLLNEALYNLQRHFIDYPNWNKYYDLSSKILNSNDIENYYNLATALMNPKVIEVGENREQYNIQKDTLKENIKRCEEFLNQNALDLNGKSILKNQFQQVPIKMIFQICHLVMKNQFQQVPIKMISQICLLIIGIIMKTIFLEVDIVKLITICQIKNIELYFFHKVVYN